MSANFLSVIVPLCDDEAIVGPFLEDLERSLRGTVRQYEVILVDDWSADGTVQAVADKIRKLPGIRLIRLSRRHGTDVAITAGLEASIGDQVVVMRADRDPPREIAGLLRALSAEHDLDVVVGAPLSPESEGWLFQSLRSVFARLSHAMTGVRLPNAPTTFIALTRKAVDAITRVKQKQRYLPWICCSVGFKQGRHPYAREARGQGHRRPLAEALGLGWSTLATSTTIPLRIVALAGLAAAGFNLLYVGYVFAVNLLKSHVAEGWTTLSLQSSSMFFMVFVIQAVMSEYLCRILDESKARPLYHVLDELGGNVAVHDPNLRNVETESDSGGDKLSRAA
jgi:polyisoprenyl-phosphate glycosyltransferase